MWGVCVRAHVYVCVCRQPYMYMYAFVLPPTHIVPVATCTVFIQLGRLGPIWEGQLCSCGAAAYGVLKCPSRQIVCKSPVFILIWRGGSLGMPPYPIIPLSCQVVAVMCVITTELREKSPVVGWSLLSLRPLTPLRFCFNELIILAFVCCAHTCSLFTQASSVLEWRQKKKTDRRHHAAPVEVGGCGEGCGEGVGC